ncbi:hypothetical protein [Dryocola sp. BD613]|uniref:hypothetical protein n=1 Tax=Dryocola sp. BD613 TaxID=3133272 RepID=UPI003F508D89
MNAGHRKGCRFWRGLSVRRSTGHDFSLFKILALRGHSRNLPLALLPFTALAL